ncbi:MAG: T9SS C-terminal target domain-containing protein [Bacteroidetes bacterium]|nr:MAG: T9SS C-terminal target domain-containing protein [Bacteroidota bacterium]
MRIITIIILILLSAFLVRAQHLTPVVIGGAGSDNATEGYHLSWTLGEVVITTHTQPEATLLQGFQQPNYVFTQLIEGPGKDYKILVFPNPTTDNIRIEVTGIKKPLNLEIFDVLGELVIIKELEPSITDINLSNIPSGTYLIRLTGDNGVILGVWRILKIS